MGKEPKREIYDYLTKITPNIGAFCTALNFSPRERQKEFLDSFTRCPESTDIEWDRGEGRTTATVVASLWWLLKNTQGRCLVVCPTLNQSIHIWLTECKKILEKADPRLSSFYTLRKTGAGLFGEQKHVWGLSTISARSVAGFQGICAEKLLIVCDEYQGIKQDVMATIQDYQKYGGVVLRTIPTQNR